MSVVLNTGSTSNPYVVPAGLTIASYTRGSSSFASSSPAIYNNDQTRWTINNAGIISGIAASFEQGNPVATVWVAGNGIKLSAGGVVSNQGQVTGQGGTAISITGGAGNVTNTGSIGAISEGTLGGRGILLAAGGSVVNNAGATVDGANIGIEIDSTGASGSVANTGTIAGSIAVEFNHTDSIGDTLTNSGAIRSTGGAAGVAVQFDPGDTGSDRVIVAPAASFVGLVEGGIGANVLELTPGSASGVLSDIGGQFLSFGTVQLDIAAKWVLNTTAGQATSDSASTEIITLGNSARLEINTANLPGSAVYRNWTVSFVGSSATLVLDNPAQFAGTIANFALNDVLELSQVQATSAGINAGRLTVTESSGSTLTFSVSGVGNGICTVTNDVSGNALITVSATPIAPVPDDFSGDRSSDILWRNNDGDVGFWDSSAGGIFTGVDLGVISADWNIEGTGDFNGDGKADILWRNNNGDVELWNSKAAGGFAGVDLGPIGADWHIEGVGDFNGDGKADILWRNNNGDVTLWNSTSTGSFTSLDLGVIGADWQIAGTGDFNGDGKADIVWRNSASGDVELWNSQAGGGFAGFDLGPISADWHIEGTGDFNGDSKSDILWRNNNGDVDLWNSTSSGGFAGLDLGVVGADWQIAGTGDFNGDAKTDILWRNNNGDVETWNSNGSAGFSDADLGPISADWRILNPQPSPIGAGVNGFDPAGDFNGDGKADILWRNNNGDIHLWNSNAGGTFTTFDLGVISANWSIEGVGDFNGDSKTDILWRNNNGDVYLWNSTSTGSFTSLDLGVIGADWQIAGTGDFNGDGKADILWRNNNGDVYLWNSNTRSLSE